MSDYRKLKVWQKAHCLALDAHRAAVRIKGNHYAPFRSQIIRSPMSIPANIVEGREQKTDRSFVRFLVIALASASELESHFKMANDIGMLTKGEYLPLKVQVAEVRMMLHGLIRTIQPDASRPKPLQNGATSKAGSGKREAGSS